MMSNLTADEIRRRREAAEAAQTFHTSGTWLSPKALKAEDLSAVVSRVIGSGGGGGETGYAGGGGGSVAGGGDGPGYAGGSGTGPGYAGGVISVQGAGIKPLPTRAIEFIASQPWAITREALTLIDNIAHRVNEAPEAVAAKLGRPLQNTRTMDVRSGVAILPVTGPIFRYANLFTDVSGASSVETMALDLQTALDDPAVKSIVLNIDSPGGMVAGISEFADMVRASSKPVTAYVGDLAASAAYWIAAAASEIVVGKAAELGSVGAVMQMRTNADKTVTEIVSSQSPNKRPDPATDSGRVELQARVDALAQVFIDAVAEFRGVDAETVVNGFGRGGMKVGEAAVLSGMADRIGSFESVIAGLSGGTERNGPMTGTIKTSEITRDYIAAEHPAIADAFRAEGGADIEKTKAEAAQAERDRIKAVLEVGAGGDHEALAMTLAFDGKTTPAEAALKIVAADKELRGKRLNSLRADAPKPVAASAEGDVVATRADELAAMPVEERAKAKWNGDAKIRAEFGDFATFLAYEKADAEGRIKRLSRTAT